MSIAVLFIIAMAWEQPECPSVDEWIKKLWYIYTVEFYAAVKKKEILPSKLHEWTWNSNLQCDGICKWGLWEVIRSEGWNPH